VLMLCHDLCMYLVLFKTLYNKLC